MAENLKKGRESKIELRSTSAYKCDICEETFETSIKLKSHRRVHRGSKGKRPYECDTCGNSFRYPHRFLSHQNIHANIRFDCKICGKKIKGSGI